MLCFLYVKSSPMPVSGSQEEGSVQERKHRLLLPDLLFFMDVSEVHCQEKEVGLKGKKTRTRSNSHYMRQICRISGSEWVQHPSAELSSLWDKQLHSVWPSRRKYNSFGSRHALPDLNKAVRIVFSSISRWVLLRSLLGES